jgi:hypothetical protein
MPSFNLNTLYSAIVVSTLSACSSTSPTVETDSSALKQKVRSIYLNAALVKKNDKYVLSEKLILTGNSPKWLTNEYLPFDGQTLFPKFNTERFECKVATGACEPYETSVNPFVKVNGFTSDYGDTYSEKVKNGDFDETLLGTGVSAISYAFVGVYLAPIFVLGGVLGATSGAVNLAKEGSVYKNKWVEFDHDQFVSVVKSAVDEKYGSTDAYITYMSDISINSHKLTKQNSSRFNALHRMAESKIASLIKLTKPYYQNDFNSNILTLPDVIMFEAQYPSHGDANRVIDKTTKDMTEYYVKIEANIESAFVANTSLIIARKHSLDTKRIARQKSDLKQAISSKEISVYINKYQNNDPGKLLGIAKKKRIKAISKEEMIAFNKAKTIQQITEFISKYQSQDHGNLISKAKEIREQSITYHKKRVTDELNGWRDNLKVGQLTFCGYIIDKKDNMIRIALNTRLEGYSAEQWLSQSEVFKPESNCYNRNGNVSPQYVPYNISYSSSYPLVS